MTEKFLLFALAVTVNGIGVIIIGEFGTPENADFEPSPWMALLVCILFLACVYCAFQGLKTGSSRNLLKLPLQYNDPIMPALSSSICGACLILVGANGVNFFLCTGHFLYALYSGLSGILAGVCCMVISCHRIIHSCMQLSRKAFFLILLTGAITGTLFLFFELIELVFQGGA